jgi:ABC-type amino acid transport substrate-binding protein
VRKSQLIFLLFVAFVAGLAGALASGMKVGKSGDRQAIAESTYYHVLRTQTLRCGYIVWTPFLIKDPNTAQLSGIFYDYTEALGKALHLKIEWTEEMGWSDFPSALENGRVDGMCAGGWANSARARVIDFVRPILYQPVYVYARADDKRFDNNLAAIDDPAITIVGVEGSSQTLIATQDFPKAKLFQLPELTSLPEIFVNLVSGKADVAITNPATADQYTLHNPGKIHRVITPTPIRLFANGIAIPAGQDRFRRMLDLATEEMLSSGQVERIITKYDNSPDVLLRVALPYKNPEATH